MTTATKRIETQIAVHDAQDALRVVQAAITLSAAPGMISAQARELAAVRLREMAANHPRAAEVLHAVVQHLESYT